MEGLGVEEDSNESNVEKVDVQLGWKDFVFSVEEIRHRKYDKSFHDKDWFKLSPLEVFLLGCKSIGTNGKASEKVGTINIGIDSVKSSIFHQPRIFLWMIEALTKILVSEDCSLFMWQRCWDIFKTVFKGTKTSPRLSLWMCSAIADKKDLLMQTSKSPLHRSQVEELISSLPDLDPNLEAIQDFLKTHFSTESIRQCSELTSFQDLTSFLKSMDVVCPIVTRWIGFLVELLLEDIANNADKKETTAEDIEISNADDVNTQVLTANRIYQYVTDLLTKVFQISQNSSYPGLALQILQNVVTNIARKGDSLMTDEEFGLSAVTDIFLGYTEAVVSPLREQVLCNLYEFLTSTDEMGVTRIQSLTFYVPNLLGAVFGVADPEVLTEVLQYGSSAFRSKHRSSLLGEGLFFINKVRALFESDITLRSRLIAFKERITAVTEASSIVALLMDCVDRKLDCEDVINIVNTSDTSFSGLLSTPNDAYDSDSNDTTNSSNIVQKVEDQISYMTFKSSHETNTLTQITQSLLHLACLIIRGGENVAYTFASILPNLFHVSILPDVTGVYSSTYFREYPSPRGAILWNVDKKEFAVKLLSFCNKCLSLGVASPFQICVGLVTKLVKNINNAKLSDQEKMGLLIDYIDACADNSSDSKDYMASQIAHGSDLVSMLMPTDGIDEMRRFLKNSGKLLAKLSGTTSLFLLKLSCAFMLKEWDTREREIKALFLMLLTKNNRDDIRCVYSLCQDWLSEKSLTFVVDALLSYPNGKLKSKNLQCLSENVIMAITLRKELIRSVCDTSDQSPSRTLNSPDYNIKNGAEEITAVESCKQFIKLLFEEIRSCIECDNRQSAQSKLKEKLSRLSLYNILFHEDLLHRISQDYSNTLQHIDTSIFPDDVRQDSKIMNVLQSCAVRITGMQMPRYASLKSYLTSLLQQYLTLELCTASVCEAAPNVTKPTVAFDDGTMESCPSSPRVTSSDLHPVDRSSTFESIVIDSIDKNKELKSKLISSGYSQQLWSDPLCVDVVTDGGLNTEENHTQALLACFREYGGLLHQLGISQILFDGKRIPVDDVFADDLPLVELKGRRAAVVREIEKQCSRSQINLQQRKFALLAEEERIESELEKQASSPRKPQQFQGRLNVRFMDCASCCGPQIVGCYAPTGDHCERPLEIGLRADSAIASIYDDQGVEIENSEVLFTGQGMYIFKAYSSGHPFDTSKVWIELFKSILDKLELVHAIILPFHFPNGRTWEEIRSFGTTELTGTVLSCDFDFSNDWRSYYDFRPESIRAGKDIVMQKDFFNDRQAFTFKGFRRQISFSGQKDLGGLIFNDFMEKLLQDENLKEFRFLGKYIAQYINYFLENGEHDFTIISNNFDYERWRKRQKQTKAINLSKDDVVQGLLLLVEDSFSEFMASLELDDFFAAKRKQFFQLRDHVSKLKTVEREQGCAKMPSMLMLNKIIKSNINYRDIQTFPEHIQESLMHWIFSNEDRVWRYRGGRDEYETLDQYLHLLPHIAERDRDYESNYAMFSGILACVKSDEFSIKDVVGYAVGEYINSGEEMEVESSSQTRDQAVDSYEVITVWVDKRYRGLQIASDLYSNIFSRVESPFIVFDVLGGSVDSIIRSSPIFELISKFGLTSYVIKEKRLSYNVRTTSGEEQFERLVVRRLPLVLGMRLYAILHTLSLYPEIIGVLLCAILSIVLYAIFSS